MVVATSSPDESQELEGPWLGTWGQGVLLLIAAVVAYLQSWLDTWPNWVNDNATYTHGPLIVLVAAWLVWRARPEVNRIEAKSSARALPFLILLSTFWVLAEKANVFIVYAALWPLIAFSALWVGLGFQVASRFALPLVFLFFAIPVWDYLRPALQTVTTTMVGLFTVVLRVPAVFDGPYVTLPTGKIFIAEDCSGAHFLCIALAVGVLAGVLRRDTLSTRILILTVAGLLSMAFNWLRVLLIVLAYLHPGLKGTIETMEGHLTLGWWVFALDLLVFGLVLRFIPRSPHQPAEDRPLAHDNPIRSNNRASFWMSMCALVVLPTITWVLPRLDSYSANSPGADLGLSTANADRVAPDLRWMPRYSGTVWEGRFAVASAGGVVIDFYGNRYNEQTQGSELVSVESHLFDPANFTPESSHVVELRGSAGRPLQARREVLLHNSGTYWLAYYAYFVDAEPVTSGHRVQLKTAFRSTYARTSAGVIAVATPCVEKCDSLTSLVEETFIQAFEEYREGFSE